jgi:DNA gyrase subunit A
MKLIEHLKALLADINKIALIKEELIEIRDKYGDERRSLIGILVVTLVSKI